MFRVQGLEEGLTLGGFSEGLGLRLGLEVRFYMCFPRGGLGFYKTKGPLKATSTPFTRAAPNPEVSILVPLFGLTNYLTNYIII